MKIIAHRGQWNNLGERNSINSLKKAFSNGFGIETDIRDRDGKLVISHDIPNKDSPLLEEIFKEYKKMKLDVILALNIKADGIQEILFNMLSKYEIVNYFIFDMSIPEMVISKKVGLNFYTRHSDIESKCVLYDDAKGVWLDSFYNENWLTIEIIEEHLSKGKMVSIISSEIHGFENKSMWKILKKYKENDNIFLCTDLPKEAKEFFYD